MVGDNAAVYDYYAKYFENVEAYAADGGVDLAYFYDSPGNNRILHTQPTAQHQRRWASVRIQLHGNTRLRDWRRHRQAQLFGSSGNDTFHCKPVTVEQGAIGKPTEAAMFDGSTYYNRASGYENVFGDFGRVRGSDGAGSRETEDSDAYDEDYSFELAFAICLNAVADHLYRIDGRHSADIVEVAKPLGTDSDTLTVEPGLHFGFGPVGMSRLQESRRLN